MHFKTLTPAALCLLAVAPALAQTPSLPAGRVVLPEKTEVKLTLEKDLKSGADKTGEVVRYEVERDVFSPFPAHVLLIPAGAEAFGKVTRSSRRGMLGKGGKLEFTCDYVQAPDGTHVPLRADTDKERGRNNTGTSVAVAAILFAPALLMSGRDITVHKGQEVTAFVDQDTLLPDPKIPAAAAPAQAPPSAAAPASAVPGGIGAPQTLFTLTDGSQVVGRLAGFDGSVYTVATAAGTRSLPAASVKSMFALPGASAAAAAPAAPASAPPAPRLPVIKAFPQHARLELNDGNSYFGDVTAFDGTAYTVKVSGGTLTLKEADVKSLQLLPSTQ